MYFFLWWDVSHFKVTGDDVHSVSISSLLFVNGVIQIVENCGNISIRWDVNSSGNHCSLCMTDCVSMSGEQWLSIMRLCAPVIVDMNTKSSTSALTGLLVAVLAM